MTWAFYLYCVLRRFGDLGFYWPGSDWFFWANYLALVALGGASCALVTIFALRFPSNRLEGWRIPANRAAVALAIILPLAWFGVFGRIVFLGLPSQWLFDRLVNFTSIVYLAAAAIFIATLVRSHGDERQRMRWILVFPVVLLLRVAAINIPYSLPDWFSGLLTALGVCVPLTVAYAVIRQRVFNIQFAISRALIYGAITTIIAGTFLLLDWFMGKEFAQTQLTLTAEIIVALALGSSLSMLHHGVDRFVDGTFFRARHEAEKRLARAAVALSRADSHQMVDRFLVHEPVQALDLTSGALFHRDHAEGRFVREIAAGWSAGDVGELAEDDPLVLHLLAEGVPIRLADVRWSTEDLPSIGNSVLATPVLLRDELLTIVLYGPHHNGSDIDPDEVRSIVKLAESAGATYDHIEARMLRAEVESLKRELAGRLTASPKALSNPRAGLGASFVAFIARSLSALLAAAMLAACSSAGAGPDGCAAGVCEQRAPWRQGPLGVADPDPQKEEDGPCVAAIHLAGNGGDEDRDFGAYQRHENGSAHAQRHGLFGHRGGNVLHGHD